MTVFHYLNQADEIILKRIEAEFADFQGVRKREETGKSGIAQIIFINFNFLFFYIGTSFYQSPKQTKSSSDKNFQLYVPNTN